MTRAPVPAARNGNEKATDAPALKNFQLGSYFDHFAAGATKRAGSPLAFILALASVAVWAISGRLFHYSENWQLVINTGTTIVTFLMVFLIQQSQNKDSVAVHLKLDELLSSQERASNKLVDIENLDETQLKRIAAFYAQVARRAQDHPNEPACSFGDGADENEERKADQKIAAGLLDSISAKHASRSPGSRGPQKKDEK